MDRNDLYKCLAWSRFQVEVAAERFTRMTEGVDHPLVEAARNRLQAAGTAVTNAAGGLSGWTRTWIDAVALAGAGWGAAALADRLVGLSHGWAIAVSAAVASGLLWPVYALNNALARRVDRRRTRRPEPSSTAVRVEISPEAEVLALVRMARDELTLAANRRLVASRYGHLAGTAAGYDWVRRRDPQLYWITQADRQLCQVVYAIELWLPSRDGER